LIAQLSIRLQIPPQAVLDLDTEMFRMLIKVLNEQAEEAKNVRNTRRR
jgi:DNA invertase Pin-like site-specific DNA recombinase